MKGILFRPEIWQAKLKVLNHGEAQTRRVMKPQPDLGLPKFERYSHITVGNFHPTKIDKDGEEYPGDAIFGAYTDDGEWGWKSPYQVGEVVYIKEAWATEKRYDPYKPSELPYYPKIFYVSDGVGEWPSNLSIGRLRSPLHLPEEFARYFITIIGARAERLQEITEEDAIAEGMAKVDFPRHWPIISYGKLWNSLNPKYPWKSNPWVWVYTFKQGLPGD